MLEEDFAAVEEDFAVVEEDLLVGVVEDFFVEDVEGLVVEDKSVELVGLSVVCVLLFDINDEEEALHWAVWSTVTVTVCTPFQEAQASPTGARFSTSCSAARGAAAASPKMEERMMVERMATRNVRKD